MFFFGKRKIITAVCFFVFMAVCGWFWRNRETVSFVSQPLSTAEAPFQYGTSQISLLARYGGATIGQIINHWKEVIPFAMKMPILRLNRQRTVKFWQKISV